MLRCSKSFGRGGLSWNDAEEKELPRTRKRKNRVERVEKTVLYRVLSHWLLTDRQERLLSRVGRREYFNRKQRATGTSARARSGNAHSGSRFSLYDGVDIFSLSAWLSSLLSRRPETIIVIADRRDNFSLSRLSHRETKRPKTEASHSYILSDEGNPNFLWYILGIKYELRISPPKL